MQEKEIKPVHHKNKYWSLYIEFCYWLITPEGAYYKQLVSAIWVIVFFLILIGANIYISVKTKTVDYMVVSLLFVYIIYNRVRAVLKLKKETLEE